MKSQLDVCSVETANCCDTAMSSGTAPKTYHKKAVKPAHNAAELNSPSSGLEFTCRSYPSESDCRAVNHISPRPSTPLPPFQPHLHLYLAHQRKTVVEVFLRRTKTSGAKQQNARAGDFSFMTIFPIENGQSKLKLCSLPLIVTPSSTLRPSIRA